MARIHQHCGAGLSRTTKMPCPSWSLPARFTCPAGARNAQTIPDSPCAHCYATRGNYRFPEVRTAQWQRLAAVHVAIAAGPQSQAWQDWTHAMAAAIYAEGCTLFRLHDSGDFFCRSYLELWIDVIERLPDVTFFAPTQETALVLDYVAHHGPLPRNLVLRPSATRIDEPAPDLCTTYVTRHPSQRPPRTVVCNARARRSCGHCRACWTPSVRVAYPIH